jgi:hypothetical protein
MKSSSCLFKFILLVVSVFIVLKVVYAEKQDNIVYKVGSEIYEEEDISEEILEDILYGKLEIGGYKWESMYMFGHPTESQKKAYSMWLEYLETNFFIYKKDEETIIKHQNIVKKEVTPIVIKNEVVKISGVNTNNNLAIIKKISNNTYIRPCAGSVTQGYKRGHLGLDIASKMNTLIVSSRDGIVSKVSVGWSGGYGNMVTVDHGDGVLTRYAHLNTIYVKSGQYIKQGHVIGGMGNTGRVRGITGIHLHFEIIVNGNKKNTLSYIK